jgi:arginase
VSAVIEVPFHLDEHVPDLVLPLTGGRTVRPELPPGTQWERLAALQEAVAERVAATDGPVVVSGCCTTALGTVVGLQRAGLDPAIVWFDAHGDLQTPQTSTSGYAGGMVLRQLVGGADPTSARRLGLRPVAEGDVLLVDARDLDPPEADFLASSAIRRVPVAEAPGALPPGHLYLHVDLDVLEPGAVGGLMFPVPGGAPPEALRSALAAVLATGRVAGIGLACTYRPGHRPAAAVAELVADLFGA